MPVVALFLPTPTPAHAFGPGPGADLLSTMIVGSLTMLVLVVPATIAGSIMGPRRGFPPFRGAVIGGTIGFAAALLATAMMVASNAAGMPAVIWSGLVFLSIPAGIAIVTVATITRALRRW